MNERVRWSHSAKLYASLAPKITLYRMTAVRLVKFAEIEGGMSVADLGCGSSGLMINEILRSRPNVQIIYGIDISPEMIQELEANLNSTKVRLICAPAESVHELIDTKLDRILANSAIWLFPLDHALSSIRIALRDQGLLAFNISEWDVILPHLQSSARYDAIDEELSRRGMPRKKYRGSAAKIRVEELYSKLKKAGLSVVREESFTVPMSVDDWKIFYSIPAIVKRSLPDIEFEAACAILHEAMDRMGEAVPSSGLQWLAIGATPARD